MTLRSPAQSCSKNRPCSRLTSLLALAQHVVEAENGVLVALELADDGAGVEVVDAGETQPLGDDAERDAVVLLPGVGRVPGAMHVQQHVVLGGPLGHRLDGGPSDDEVDHDHDRPQFLGELGALVHLLHRRRGDVEVVTLDLAARRLGAVDRLHAVQESVAPLHERLRVDVLVVLGEVEATAKRLVDDASVVLARQPELGLDRGAEKRAAELVEPLALDDDPRGRAVERRHVRSGEPHVLEAQRLDGLEAEDVADDRRREVGDRARLEELEIVGDVGEELVLGARHGLDPVRLGAVLLGGGEPVGPHHRPRGGRRLTCDRSSGLDPVDALLRRDAEHGEDVGVLGLVVAVPVAHLRVLHDTGPVSLGRVLDGGGVLHSRLLDRNAPYRMAIPNSDQ